MSYYRILSFDAINGTFIFIFANYSEVYHFFTLSFRVVAFAQLWNKQQDLLFLL